MLGKRFLELYNRSLETASFCETVERIAFPASLDEFAPIAKAGLPVVLKSTSHRQTWTSLQEILIAKYGHLMATIRRGDYASPAEYANSRHEETMDLRTYLMGLVNDEPLPPYLGNLPIDVNMSAVLGVSAPYYGTECFETPRLWIGLVRTITPLHKDYGDNFAFHLCGKKRWTLFPIQDVPALAMTMPLPAKYPDFATSALDLRKRDDATRNALAKCRPVQIDVDAGEILYLPAGWSHYVEAVAPTVMAITRALELNPKFAQGSRWRVVGLSGLQRPGDLITTDDDAGRRCICADELE